MLKILGANGAEDFRENAVGQGVSGQRDLREGPRSGLEQGLAKGLEEGRAAEKLEVARNFLRLGVDVETISKATGLSVEVLSEMQD